MVTIETITISITKARLILGKFRHLTGSEGNRTFLCLHASQQECYAVFFLSVASVMWSVLYQLADH